MMVKLNKVGVTGLSRPSDLEVRVTRVVDAPRTLVFEAWTSEEHLPHWMTGPPGWTMSVCEIDLRPQGRYRFVWTRPDRGDMEITGTYLEIDPPLRLVSTERWGGDWAETTNTLVLVEVEGQTTMSLTLRYPSKEARDAALQTGMKEGMDISFDSLDAHLRRVTSG